MNILPSNEEPSVLTRSRREEMMQKLSLLEKEEINRLPKKDLHYLKSGTLYTKDVDYYMDYLQKQDEIMCRKIHRRKPSLFYNIGFITFDNTNNPKSNTTTPRCASGKNIFNMRYIFIPIHYGLHFTCAVIYMEQMKIKYYDSLRFDNVTRHGCRHKVQNARGYTSSSKGLLAKEHMKDKRIDLPNEWKLYTRCNVPQQNTTDTTDCGVFVCMYCNFILNDCKLDFNQDNITNSHWRDRMILSILLVKPKNDKEKNNNDKVPLRAIKMKWNNKQKNIASVGK